MTDVIESVKRRSARNQLNWMGHVEGIVELQFVKKPNSRKGECKRNEDDQNGGEWRHFKNRERKEK